MKLNKTLLSLTLISTLSACSSHIAESTTIQETRHNPELIRYSLEELPELEAEGRRIVKSAYIQEADIQNCVPAQITEKEKQKALDELNKIRRAHNLDDVLYNPSNDKYTAASALNNVANKTITHYPSKNSICYSEEAAEGSKESNLSIKVASSVVLASRDHAENTIDDLLIDENVESLGHRAWFLNPFLNSISYGRASSINTDYTDTVSVYIKDGKSNLSNNAPEYVAYPYKTYSEYWFKHGWYSSFSVIINKNDFWANKNVDYSVAKIYVVSEAGVPLKVTNITFTRKTNKSFAGLPNLLQWQIQGTKNNQKYHVQIKNVLIEGRPKNYEYWFEIK